MRSIVYNHPVISILFAQGTIYAAAYAVYGSAGVHVLAIVVLACMIVFLTIAAEKLLGSLRKKPSA